MGNTQLVPSALRPYDIDAYRHEEGVGHVDFVELAPATQSLPAAPAFILGGLSAPACAEMFAGHWTGPAGFYVVRGASLTFDGIVTRGRVMLTGSLVNFPEQHCLAILRAMAPQGARALTRRAVAKAALLFGPGWATWGHWLVDFIPRLFLMQRAGRDPFAMRWIIPAATPRFARDLLKLFGFRADSLLEYEPGQEFLDVEELIMPVNLTAGAQMHPLFADAVAWMKQRMRPGLPEPAERHSRIFITRGSNPLWRELLNRSEIEAIARSQGYTVADPAGLSVWDQIGLFRYAVRIAGEYGSGLHTSIFAPAGGVVTCIRGSVHSAGVLQAGLTAACGQKIGYIVGDSHAETPTQAYSVNGDMFRLGLQCAELAAPPIRPHVSNGTN